MKSILMCDNDPMIRMELKSMLKELGFEEILECADGESAVAMAWAGSPAMAILDSAIAVMDGMTAAIEIRKRLKIPIILMTGSGGNRNAKQAVRSGIAAFLSKPLRKQDLLPTIEIALAYVKEVAGLKGQVKDLTETIGDCKVFEKAKCMLMEKERLSEAEACRVMQKMAMTRQMSLRQISDRIMKQGQEEPATA